MRKSLFRVVFITTAVALCMGRAEAGEPALGPEMGPVVAGLFDFDCDWKVESIGLQRSFVLARVRLTDGSSCEVRLVHPDSESRGGLRRTHAGVMDILAQPDCPSACVKALSDRVSAAAGSLAWKTPGKSTPGSSGDRGSWPLWLVAAIGLLAVAGVAFLAFVGFRSLFRMPGGALALGFIAVGTAALAALAVAAPYQTGDEVTNFTSSLTGAFSLFDLVEYPHPTLYFNLSSALYGLYAALTAITGGLSIEESAAKVILFHHADLLIASRLLSVLFWAGLMGTVYAITIDLTGDRWSSLVAVALVLPANVTYSTSFSPYSLGIFLGYLVAHRWAFASKERAGIRDAAVSGLLAGCALASHYLTLLFMPLWLAVPARHRGYWKWSGLPVLLAAAALAFLAIDFRVFLDLGDYLDSWAWRLSEITIPDVTDVNRHVRASYASSPLFYLKLLSSNRVLPFALAGLVTSVAVVVRSYDTRRLLAALLPVFLLGVLSAPATRFEQYVMFVYPSLAVLGACGLHDLMGTIPMDRVRPVATGLLAAFLLLSAAAGIYDKSLDGGASPREGDPVAEFMRWAGETPADGERIGVSCPYVPHPPRAIREGRMSPLVAKRLEALMAESTPVDVRWVGATDSPGRGDRGLESVDWFYLVDREGNEDPEPAGLRGKAPVTLEPVSAKSLAGLRHLVYKVGRGPHDNDPAPQARDGEDNERKQVGSEEIPGQGIPSRVGGGDRGEPQEAPDR